MVKVGAVVAAYATREDRPDIPFCRMLFDNVTIRLLGSDDFPAAAKQQAAADLTYYEVKLLCNEEDLAGAPLAARRAGQAGEGAPS